MKVLKRQVAMAVLCMLCVAAFVLAVVFTLPARPVNAEEITPVTVSAGETLQQLVKEAGTEKKVFKLDSDVELPVNWTDNGWSAGLIIDRGQDITIDVNGHKLASRLEPNSGIVFYNMGTLTVIDSSEGRSGKVVSHGAIDNQEWSAALMALTMNYGNLTLDVEFGLEQPASTEPDTLGYYTDTKNGVQVPSVYIHNEFIAPKSVDEEVNHVSLTINGGSYDFQTIAGNVRHFFYIKAADLTINGGTFRNSSTETPYYGGFLADLDSLDETNGTIEEKIVEDRHVVVTINDCDIRGKYFGDGFFETQQYKPSIPNEKYTVKIFGGIFPADYSGYTDVDHTMVEETITENEGQTVVESFWVVVKADKTNVAAVITQNGDPVKYCQTFEDAWAAAMLMTENKTIVLNKDSVVTQTLKFNHLSKDTTLDLNGHTLTSSPGGNFLEYHFYRDAYAGNYGKFIVCDNSDAHDGELVLTYKKDMQYGGIHMLESFQFVLESGTVRIVGEKPTKVSPEQLSVFSIPLNNSTNKPKENAVIINGGNIVSDLPVDDVKVVAWKTGSYSWSDKIDSATDEMKASFKIAYPDLATNLDTYLEACGGMRFSWDLKNFVGQEFGDASPYKWAEIKEGYVFLKAKEIANYYAANGTYGTFASALAAVANAEDKTISALNDVTEADGITIPDGVTLNLSKYLNYTLTGNVTLESGASLFNGSVDGTVTVNGAAAISNAKLKQALTVTDTGSVSLYDGTYDGQITVNGTGKLTIYGGKFSETLQLESYDRYIYPGFGATEPSGGYRTVKAGVASLAALEWYDKKGVDVAGIQLLAAGDTYQINSVEEWLYFSSIVNSGKDSFKDATVTLNAEVLDFGGKVFLTAGICGHPFAGTFNGKGNTISNVDAQELTIGLFGKTDSGCIVNDLTIVNSHFTAGSGYFDEANQSLGYLAAGSVVGDGYLGTSADLKIKHDTIDQEGSGRSFLGAVIGHTYSSVSLKDPKIADASVQLNWKSGGIVGYVEGGLTLDGGSISELEFTGETGWYPGGVLAGDLNSRNATVTNAKIDCPDLALNGGSSSGVQVTVDGTKTDIHVGSLGRASQFNFTLGKDDTDSAQLQVGSALPNNVTIQDADGNEIEREENPDGDGFIMQAAPKNVEVFYGDGEILDSFDTLAKALEAAQKGNRIYLKESLNESVTVSADKDVTINLYKNTLTGTITVEGNLTLENGTLMGSIASTGSLILAKGESGLIIDNSAADPVAAAVTGEYTLADEDVCVRKTMSGEIMTRLELALTHEFTKFTAAGNVITVSCEYGDKEAGTITLVAEDFTYDGAEHPATVVMDPEGLVSEPITITYKYSKTAGGPFETFEGEPMNSGYYKASITVGDVTATVEFASLRMAVIVSDIQVGSITYGDEMLSCEATSFTLKTASGTTLPTDGLTLTVTLKKSNYNVGTNVALIVGLSLDGDAMADYTLALAGQQAFVEVEVTPARLVVRAVGNGTVEYEGFVNGEDESVLTGELVLERKGNVITPSGLESANYDIVFESVTVPGDLTALWVGLAIAGMSAILAAGLYIGYRRKRQ